jgi:hypothetical protein
MLRQIIHTLSGRVTFTALRPAVVGKVLTRFNRIRYSFERIAGLVAAGKYIRRHHAKPPRPAAPGSRKPPPRPEPEMRKFGWLGDMHPDLPPLRGTLLYLLQDPEMVRMIAAAPNATIPPLRSLCWMLGWKPPPILALPKRPRPPKPPKPEAAQPAEPADAQPEADAEALESFRFSLPGLPKLPGPRWPKGVKRWRNPKIA